MLLRNSLLVLMSLVLAGCAPSAQEQLESAKHDLDRAQRRLDNLRPAYDTARQTAILAVCKEIAGVTPDESATAALKELKNAVGQAADEQAKSNKKPANIDDTIDNLISAQKTMQESQDALTAPLEKVNDVMANIKTPGTPEAKRLEEVLSAMPEAKAYERQQERVERAQQAVDEAEAATQ